MGPGEFVIWEATHFGIRQRLTTKITAFDAPNYFRDEQVKGIFKKLEHDHFFKQQEEHTIMQDVFYYAVPYGLSGKIFDKAFLHSHLQRLLLIRNSHIRRIAESGEWKQFL